MKKILVILLLFFVAAGVGAFFYQRKPAEVLLPTPSPEASPIEEQQETPEKEEQTLEVKNEEEFVITLEANPTTGYDWEAAFDENYLELLEKKYLPPETTLVGAGGQDKFRFKALESGETEIVFSYERPWEKESIKQQIYKISIHSTAAK